MNSSPSPPEAAATQRHTRSRWFTRSSTATTDTVPTVFTIPTNFDDVSHQKCFKSNSWFNHGEKAAPASKKQVRRIASAPNANKMMHQHKEPSPPPVPHLRAMGMSSTHTLATSDTAVSDSSSQYRWKMIRRSYAANSVKVREVQVGPSR